MSADFKKYPFEIILFLIISIIIFPLLIMDIKNIIRIILGLPIIFFIPGYLFLFVLFPFKKKGIGLLERFILSIGFSICIISFIALSLNYTSIGIEIKPAYSIIFLFILIVSIFSFFRWHRINETDRFSLFENILLIKSKKKENYTFSAIVIILLIIIFLTTITIILNNESGEKFTSFYILGQDNNAANFIKNITTGDEYIYTVGINNHEGEKVDYTIEIWLINQTLNDNQIVYHNMWFIDKTSISLDHESINLESDWNAQWTYNFSLIINKKGDNLKLAFLLFKSKTDNYIKNQDYSNIAKTKINNAYRDVYLWIKVN